MAKARKIKLDTKGLQDGKYWVVLQKDKKEGMVVSTLADQDYAEMVAKFDIEKLESEVMMAHRC